MTHTRLMVAGALTLALVLISFGHLSPLSVSTTASSLLPRPGPEPLISSVTQLSMSGEPGDYIGGTPSYFYTTSTGSFGAGGADHSGDGVVDYVQISYLDNNNNWTLEFSTEHVPGTNLLPGFYDNAQRAPFASTGHPGLNVFGDGRVNCTLD
jgi:hypothetical protein